jgi:hypothetical protein
MNNILKYKSKLMPGKAGKERDYKDETARSESRNKNEKRNTKQS